MSENTCNKCGKFYDAFRSWEHECVIEPEPEQAPEIFPGTMESLNRLTIVKTKATEAQP